MSAPGTASANAAGAVVVAVAGLGVVDRTLDERDVGLPAHKPTVVRVAAVDRDDAVTTVVATAPL